MALLHSKIFREYDIRGIVGTDFDGEGVALLGQAFATKVLAETGRKNIVVAYDGRLSSPDLHAHLVRGLVKGGAQVTSIGCGPTPLLYFASHFLKAAGGVMITGSHNPPEFNGFKMIIDQKALFGSEIQHLETLIQQGNLTISTDGTSTQHSLHNEYTQHILKDFTDHYDGTNLKVAWDPGHGATAEIVQDLLAQLPGEHYLINGDIDGTFPAHHPDPTVEKNLAQLAEVVQMMGLDYGLAFDGDGDRLGIVDDQGHMLFGDQLMALFAEEVLKDHPGSTIIADVKTSQRLFDTIQEMGGVPLMWRTGHSHIKQKMRETQSPFGGEMSGHIFFADRYFGYDDGLYAALRFMGIMAQKKIALSQWADGLPALYTTPEIQIPCETQDKFHVISQIKSHLQGDEIPFNDIDGVRVTTPTGWWLLRASNTQEILVARAEAVKEKELQTSLETLEKYLKTMGLGLV